MKRVCLVALLAMFALNPAMAQGTCKSSAIGKDGRPLAGAALNSYMTKCEKDACENPRRLVTIQVAEGSGQAQAIDQLCRVGGCQGLEQIPALLSGGRDQRSDNGKVHGALLGAEAA